MAKAPEKQNLIGSLLDRLTTHRSGIGDYAGKGKSIAELKRSVCQDLERLLNTRWYCVDFPDDPGGANDHWKVKLEDTLVNYGIPDFTGMNMSLPPVREQTRMEIEKAIRRFEPRLFNVSVTIVPSKDQFERILRLRIAAMLRLKPVPNDVVFDSELKPSTTMVEVHVAR